MEILKDSTVKNSPAWRDCVHRKDVDGKIIWTVSIPKSNDVVEVSARTAQVVKMAMTANRAFAGKKSGGMSAKQREYHAYNCHRLVHAMRDLPLDTYEATHDFKPAVYTEVDTAQQTDTLLVAGSVADVVKQLAHISHFPLVAHIFNRDDVVEHSFIILGRTPTNAYICFEKKGVDSAPFRLVSLQEIGDNYIFPYRSIHVLTSSHTQFK